MPEMIKESNSSRINLDNCLFVSLLLFIAGYLLFGRNVGAKLYYVTSVIFICYVVKNIDIMRKVFNLNTIKLSASLICYSILVTMYYTPGEFFYIKSGLRLLAFLMIVTICLSSKNKLHWFMSLFVASVVIGSVPDLINYYGSGAIQDKAPFGVGLKYHWHIFAGGIYAMTMLISLSLFNNAFSITSKILWMLAVIYSSTLVYLSQSRAAIVSVVLASVIYLFFNSKRRLLSAGIFFGLASSFIMVMDGIGYKIVSLINRRDASRFDIWRSYLDYVQEYIVFGRGLAGNFTNNHIQVTEPHNLYIYRLLTGGVVGLVILLLLVSSLVAINLQALKSVHSGILPALTFFILVFNFFDSRQIVDGVGVGWILFWLPIGLVAACEFVTNGIDNISIEA